MKFFLGKSILDRDIKNLLRILVKALESFTDIVLLEALVVCLTRLQPLLRPVKPNFINKKLYFSFKLFLFIQESMIHKALFWVSVSVLQLDEVSLYAAGLALLEQNLHTLDSQSKFDDQVNSYDY